MGIKRRQFLQLAGGVTAALAASGLPRLVSAASIRVVSPRLVNPAFIEPGQSFTVEVEGDSWLNTSDWRARLRSDLGASWDCTVTRAERGMIRMNTREGWRLRVQAPSSVPPELCDLELSHASAGSAASGQSVSVVRDLEAPLYVLHITDEHVFYDSASGSTDPASGYRSAELVRRAAAVVNLINPRAVINSGDITNQFWSDGRRARSENLYVRYRDAKKGYRVPSIIVTGNHDIHYDVDHAAAAATWDNDLGLRTFATRIGSLAVFGHDYSSDELLPHMDQLYKDSWSDGGVRGRLIVQHFSDWSSYKPSSSQQPTMIMIGHLHNSKISDWSPRTLMTSAAQDYARAGLVEFRRNSSGTWESPTFDGWNNGSHRALVGGGLSPKVVATYSRANDGRATSNTVTVRNDIDRRFRDGRVRFLMARGRYAVQGGSVLAQYDYSGGTAVLVSVDIPASASVAVSIAATGTTAPAPTPVPPSGTVMPVGTWTTPVTADAQVEEAAPDRNQGQSSTITVDGSPRFESLIRFNMPQYQGQIRQVLLKVYSPAGGGTKPTIYRVDGSWSESSVTWNTRPAAQGSGVTDSGGISTGAWNRIDITQLVTGPGTYDLLLRLTVADAVVFESRQGGRPPVIEVTTQ